MNAWPTIDMMATGQNITNLMNQAGMTVRDIQNVFGFSNPQAIYKWRRGQSVPTIDNLIVLAAVLKVKIDDIIVVDDVQEKSSVLIA
ncbi:MAG: helix-turn-helix transcriptional regulator [Lachnospiraceae bacterium]|nr:helix-turn-helix transcriptional regulator [Lachnospiraceae bacterium]